MRHFLRHQDWINYKKKMSHVLYVDVEESLLFSWYQVSYFKYFFLISNFLLYIASKRCFQSNKFLQIIILVNKQIPFSQCKFYKKKIWMILFLNIFIIMHLNNESIILTLLMQYLSKQDLRLLDKYRMVVGISIREMCTTLCDKPW
jgi:hypothetical protein